MPDRSDETRRAVTQAYTTVLDDQAASDTIAFEAAVMMYRHLHPALAESAARDRAAEMVADAVYRRALGWLDVPPSGQADDRE